MKYLHVCSQHACLLCLLLRQKPERFHVRCEYTRRLQVLTDWTGPLGEHTSPSADQCWSVNPSAKMLLSCVLSRACVLYYDLH